MEILVMSTHSEYLTGIMKGLFRKYDSGAGVGVPVENN